MKHCRHYYVAVASDDLKLSTLVDLICALQARGPCALAIACSGRDVLDKLVTGLSQVKDTSIAYLHSDLEQAQRNAAVSSYLDCVNRQTQQPAKGSTAEVLVSTDVCLKALEEEARAALKLSLLVNYDLPVRKDIWARRIQTICGADDTEATGAIAVYFVTAGEMTQLRAVEGFLAPADLESMPVHVVDILLQTRQAIADG